MRTINVSFKPTNGDLGKLVFALKRSMDANKRDIEQMLPDISIPTTLPVLSYVVSSFLETADLYDRLYPDNGAVKTFQCQPWGEVVDRLQTLIKRFHNTSLAMDDEVTQVWSNGEVTKQYGGSMLWARGMTMVEPGFVGAEMASNVWPAYYDKKGFIFCTESQAMEVRAVILEAIARAIIDTK